VVLPPSPVDYLSTLPRFLLDGVLRVIKPATFLAGETIYRQGEPGDSFMVLQSGRAQSVRVDRAHAVSSPLPPPQSPAPLSTATRSLSGGGGGGVGSNKRGSLSLGAGSHSLAIAIPSSPMPFPSSPGVGGSRSARSSVTFSPQPSVLRAGSSARPSLSAAASPALVPATPNPSLALAPLPLAAAATETVQLLVVGNAFGHQHLAREMEATSQAGVARKRTMRLWHLLRLSVRRELREEEQVPQAHGSQTHVRRFERRSRRKCRAGKSQSRAARVCLSSTGRPWPQRQRRWRWR